MITNNEGDVARYGAAQLSSIDLDVSNVEVMFNSVAQELHIYTGGTASVDVEIYNQLGVRALTVRSGYEEIIAIDVNDLASGMYFAKVVEDNGKSVTRKFIKI